jgi:hypothetical protein
MKRRLTAALVGLALAISMVGTASAKITPTDTSCSTSSGHNVQGQWPTCTGGGLDQQTENQNPSGKAPPGQN